MNQILKSSLCIAVLFSTMAAARVVPYISIRSQSWNAARELVLWQTQINLYDMCNWYGSFSITPEYTRTFKSEKIARALFCDAVNNDCCDTRCVSFNVQGSNVEGRSSNAFLAENFGLPTDYNSVVTIEPRIENFLVDFNFYLGLDEWVEGLYFRIHAPVVYSRWDLGFCERITDAGVLADEIGYFNDSINGDGISIPYYGVPRSDLVSSFEDFVGNEATPTLGSIVTFDPLQHAKMSKCRRHETKLSDIQMALGWNFWMDEDYHVGLNLRACAPTGNRPEGRYLFEPIVGNGKHWEVGGGFTSHWTMWRNCDETDDFAAYLDANVTHMFKSHQCRTFDLCGKPLSRYMLAEKMSTDVVGLENVDDVAPTYQFDNEFSPVANLSTIKVDVSAAVQAEVVLKFAYTHCNWQFDLGYDFWARSCEKIHPRCNDCCTTNEPVTYWALKGDAFVYGFTNLPAIPRTDIVAVALSAAETDATIFCGTNGAVRTVGFWEQNLGVDNADTAYGTVVETPGATPPYYLSNYPEGLISHGAQAVYSSFDPMVFASNQTTQWDFEAARSKGISNKVFGNFGYIWKDHECWVPYLGIGGEAEFGQVDKRCGCVTTTSCVQKNPGDPILSTFDCSKCNSSCGSSCNKGCGTGCNTNCGTTACSNVCNTGCDDKCGGDRNENCCSSVAISQWGVWVKGGFSFN